jgi:hypothetical protein
VAHYAEGLLQEIPKGDKWSRRHLSFPGNLCLHLRDISALRQCKKAIKTQSPPWPRGPLVSGFWSHCIPHYAVFLFFSLQIKSFQPMLLESTCAFILIVGSRTLNTWNSCTCHLCIIAPLCISLFLTFKLHKFHLHPCVLPWLLPHWTQRIWKSSDQTPPVH